MDKRISDTEIQVSEQDYILQRGEIYASDLLMVQYSVEEGQKKGDLNYQNTKGILLFVLMKNSPRVFKQFHSSRYIHRFHKMVADSGLEYTPLKTTIYVQLDKCMQQFIEGKDGENNPALQLLLATMYNINDKDVMERAKDSDFMREIYLPEICP